MEVSGAFKQAVADFYEKNHFTKPHYCHTIASGNSFYVRIYDEIYDEFADEVLPLLDISLDPIISFRIVKNSTGFYNFFFICQDCDGYPYGYPYPHYIFERYINI